MFVSHASEDKESFVRAFATGLRDRGVDAWLDEWEIRPGDSLVQKIFAEGIARADALIVVLSATSITKPWVREELDALVVRRVSERMRLIPVVLGECEVPMALRATLWVKVSDRARSADAVDQIVGTLFDKQIKPPLGPSPAFATQPSIGEDLHVIDGLVLTALGKVALRENQRYVGVESVAEELAAQGVSETALLDAVSVLTSDGLLDDHSSIGTRFPYIKLTTYGFGRFLETNYDGYPELLARIEALVVNTPGATGDDLASAANCPPVVAEHILDELESEGLVKLVKTLSNVSVFDVSPKLRRRVSAR